MDRIEDKTGEMIQDIPELTTPVFKYYNNEIKPITMLNILTKYWDSLNMDGIDL